VDISINIVNASVIGAMDIGLTYDASILKATSVVNGAMIESLPDALWSYNISSGKISISFATYPDAINNDGELFIVTFDVVGGNVGDNSTLATDVEAYTMDATPQPVAVDTEDGVVVVIVKSSGDSSSSSGGGGGSSGELYENIACSETDRQYVNQNSDVSYSFELDCNIVQYVNFTGLTNAGRIATKVEILNDTSTQVDHAPSEIVYKNLNIWVGNAGWATPTNIANPTINFKVETFWISENNIDESTIRLNRYNDGKWDPLVTTQINGNADDLYFEAETPGFSSFAVTGKKVDVLPGGESIVTEPTAVLEQSPVPTPDENNPGLPGFSLFAGVFVLLIAVQLLCKNK
jgi:PGF-pre-PGF domain-containing protein